MFFNRTTSLIFFLLLLSFWSIIPGMINPHLAEADIYEMVFVIMALQFGGLLAGLIAVPYIILITLVSIHFEPNYAIRYSIAALITLPLIPLVYKLLGNNFLLTLYSFTIISYTVILVVTLFIMTAEFFETIRYMMISLPVAFITNTIYVKLFGNPLLAFFDKNLQLKLGMPLSIGGILLIVTCAKVYSWYTGKKSFSHIKTQFSQKTSKTTSGNTCSSAACTT